MKKLNLGLIGGLLLLIAMPLIASLIFVKFLLKKGKANQEVLNTNQVGFTLPNHDPAEQTYTYQQVFDFSQEILDNLRLEELQNVASKNLGIEVVIISKEQYLKLLDHNDE